MISTFELAMLATPLRPESESTTTNSPAKMSTVRRLFMCCIFACIILPIVWIVFYHDPRLVHGPSAFWLRLPTSATILQPDQLFNTTDDNNNNMIYTQASKYLLSNAKRSDKEVEPAILVVCQYKTSDMARLVRHLLLAQRVKHHLYSTSQFVMPDLVNVIGNRYLGKYSLIIIVDVNSVVSDETIYEVFQEYCNTFGVAMIFLATPTLESLIQNTILAKTINLHPSTSKMHVNYLTIHEKNDFIYLRDGGNFNWTSSTSQLALFNPTTNSQNIVSATIQLSHTDAPRALPVAMINWSTGDEIVRGFTGLPLTSSLGSLAFLEMIHLISERQERPVLRFLNKRYIQIDVDDVFFAPPGFNPTEKDIEEMLVAQKLFQNEYLPGFRFQLGFCGMRFNQGSLAEREGKQELIKNAGLFNWFDHTYSHVQPHKIELEELTEVMKANKQFAMTHGIPLINNQYSVSPHHSGVYPIYEPLYTAWKEVWNVTVTTTEEYPHFKPFNLRRGFIHNDIMVLPRLTCGVYTHSNHFSNIEGGRTGLTSIAEEGEVFTGILNNPISVFMTHYNNYGSDRLAVELFKTAFNFIKKWTKLDLASDRPVELAREYFKIFPEDKVPLWTSPCSDKRHMDIWNMKNCSQIPSILIVGPQKTGSTALQFFLKQHPNLVTNPQTKHAFEEVQFYSNDNFYSKGINWYMSNFPSVNKSTLLFEKSATYFTHPTTPLRVYTLNPHTKIIIILADPIKRAYSWYQHMKSHLDPTALEYSFNQVITARNDLGAPPTLINLRSRCLSSGLYYQYIEKWLNHFKPEQIHFVDGNELIDNPLDVLEQANQFLKLPYFDYHSILKFSSRKQYYCLTDKQGKDMCLGISKGRTYAHILPSCIKYLSKYYSHPNRLLYKQLLKMSRKPPKWLINGF